MRTLVYLCMGVFIIALMVAGCIPQDSRYTNHGGGSKLSVATKLLSNPSNPPIGDFTADEIQILGDNLSTILSGIPEFQNAPLAALYLTDEQAGDIAQFLDDYEIANVEDLAQLAQEVQSGTKQVTIPQSLIDLANSLGANIPDSLSS